MFGKLIAVVVVVVGGLSLLVGVVPAMASGPSFGVESFSNAVVGPGEGQVTQAGSHPDSLTTSIVLNHEVFREEEQHGFTGGTGEILPVDSVTGGNIHDVETQLPRGFVVDPAATPLRCSEAQLAGGGCPVSSAVGRIVIGLDMGIGPEGRAATPLYNMAPPPGIPAMIGANLGGLGIIIHIVGRVRSDGDYGLTGYAQSVLQTYPFYRVTVTLWSDPSDPSHNSQRAECGNDLPAENPNCSDPEPNETAFLTMPGACSGQPLASALSLDSWAEAAGKESVAPHDALAQSAPAMSGCGALRFEPTIEAKPETSASDSPTGLHFDLHFPQEGRFGGIATGTLKNAVVTLPAGLAVNPSSADGLEGCSPAQIGLQAPADERQAIVLASSARAFTVSLKEGESTGELAAGASAEEVREALEALPAIGAGNVEVVAKHGGWEVTYVGALAGREGPRLHGEVSTNETQKVSVEATSGSFELELDGERTSSLPYNATDAMVQEELQRLHRVKRGNVTVTGGPPFIGVYSPGYTYDVTFDGALAGEAVGTVNVVSSLLLAVHVEGNLSTGSEVVTGVEDAASKFAPGEEVSGEGIPAGTHIASVAPTTLTLTAKAAVEATGKATLDRGGDQVESVVSTTGVFAVGQKIEGKGIPPGSRIISVEPQGELTLIISNNALESATEVPFIAGIPGPGAAITVVVPGGFRVAAGAPGGESLAVSTLQAGGALLFSEKVANPGNQGLPEDTVCPAASKIGNVEVVSPLLEKPLPGSLYLAQPFDNPFDSLLAGYIVVEDPERGVVVKLAGRLELGGEEGGGGGLAPGQIRASFGESPELPVEDVRFSSELPVAHHEGLFGGSRAPLTTPSTCGSYAVEAVLEPWSHLPAAGEAMGTPDATPSSAFEITGGPGGSACAQTAAEEPNAPGFTAGTFTPIVGAYSPFVLHLSREDGSQSLEALDVTLPPGLTGKLAGIARCPQADIEAAERRSREGEGKLERESPSCPSSSELGTVTVGVGSGAPFYVKGRAYLAGPYDGGPFSVVVVTPALAGPFDLGTVVVRAGLFVNPETAQVTARSGAIPTMRDGVPLDVRSLTIELTRSQFTLNPTSCEKMPVTGTAFGESSPAAISAPFQVGGCTGLAFKPSFTVSTQGRASRTEGASLTVRVAQMQGEANIHKVDLQLPMQLPARLHTLQKACPAAQFEANPAGCPAASAIGTGKAITPLLSVPLTGPAYLVSHGGAAYPDVEYVLQGEGITIVLDGKTAIKHGITYSKFETVPDNPISSFETVLPEGPDSVLGTDLPASAKYSLCGQQLVMPTTITGQNGSVLRQQTKITITGCPNTKTTTPTRARKLANGLKACQKKYKGDKKRHKRETCEKQARHRYGPANNTKKHNNTKTHNKAKK
jgi:hypothetical protein